MSQSPAPGSPAPLPPAPGAPAPPSSSNRTLWIVLGSCLGGGLLVTLCATILIIGGLTLVGRRVSSVFTQINSDLNTQDFNDFDFTLPTAEPVDVSQALTIGAPGRSGDLELQVVASETEPGNSSAQPSAGNEFRIVKIQATNRGQQSINLAGQTQFSWIQDDAERSYDCCVFTLMPDFDSTQELTPGTTTEIELAFEVPSDAESLYWIFDEWETSEDAPLVVKLR